MSTCDWRSMRCTTTGSCPLSIRNVERPCRRLWNPNRGQPSGITLAAVAAGVFPVGCPRFGFPTLRRGLSTFLIDTGQDPLVVQATLRQSQAEGALHHVHDSPKSSKTL